MQRWYPETKRGVTAASFVVALVFGVTFGLLLGDGLIDAFTYGIVVAIGFAIGVLLFFRGARSVIRSRRATAQSPR